MASLTWQIRNARARMFDAIHDGDEDAAAYYARLCASTWRRVFGARWF